MPHQALTPIERQLLLAKSKMWQEMPDVANTPIEPMGWLDRLIGRAKGSSLGGTTLALAHPVLGKVAYSPEGMTNQSQGETEDTVAHELTHIRQGRRGGGSLFERALAAARGAFDPILPYGQQSDELEAFQTENDRALREGREPGSRPKFEGTGFRETGSVYLRPETQGPGRLMARTRKNR